MSTTTTTAPRALTFRRMPADGAEISAPPPAEPTAPAIRPDATHAEQMEFLKSACLKAGLRLPDTRVQEGEALIPAGEEKLRSMREDLANLPTLSEAADAMGRLALIERPRSFPVNLSEIRMSAVDGAITRGKGALGMSRRALAHMCDFLAPSGVRTPEHALASLSPKVRAAAFNEWADGAARVRANGKQKDPRVVLHTWKPQGGPRAIRAVTSTVYARLDDHQLVKALAEAAGAGILPAGAKARVTVADSRTDVELVWPMMAREIRVGDVLHAAARLMHSHVKDSGVHTFLELLRALCFNLTTAPTEDVSDDASSFSHVGKAEAILQKAIAAMARNVRRAEPFIQAFGDAGKRPLRFDGGAAVQTPAEVVQALESADLISQEVGKLVIGEWDADGAGRGWGMTDLGLANALTRASQHYGYDQADGIEALAGQIVQNGFVQVLEA